MVKVLTRYIALEVLQRVLLFMGVLTTLLVAGRGVEFVKQMANGELRPVTAFTACSP